MHNTQNPSVKTDHTLLINIIPPGFVSLIDTLYSCLYTLIDLKWGICSGDGNLPPNWLFCKLEYWLYERTRFIFWDHDNQLDIFCKQRNGEGNKLILFYSYVLKTFSYRIQKRDRLGELAEVAILKWSECLTEEGVDASVTDWRSVWSIHVWESGRGLT